MNYDFPVSLQKAFTKDNQEVPRVRVVVRDDTNEPLSTVSQRYQLIEHKYVVDQAKDFMSKFGNCEETHSISRNGARFVANYEFKDIAREVAVGDTVGLRLHLSNSYEGNMTLTLKIGALRLRCLNGMVSSRDLFDIKVKHVIGAELHMPSINSVHGSFNDMVGRWSSLAERSLSNIGFEKRMLELRNAGFLSEASLKSAEAGWNEMPTEWGVYNGLTSYINHKSKANSVNKLNLLSRVDELFVQ